MRKFCGNLLPSSVYFFRGAVKHKVFFIIWIGSLLCIQVDVHTFSLKDYFAHDELLIS